MFKFSYEHTDYGLAIHMEGRVCKHDLSTHIDELKALVETITAPFNILFDFSKVDTSICGDTARLLAIGRSYLVTKGLNRVAVLYYSNAHIVDLTNVFNDANFKKRARYISIMINKDAKERAIRYLKEGIEP